MYEYFVLLLLWLMLSILFQLEKQRNASGSEQEKLAANLKIAQENIKTLTKKTKETKKELSSLKEERDILNNDNQHLIKEKAKLDLTIKDLSEEVQGDNNSKERAENELARLTQSIKEKEAELEKVSQFSSIFNFPSAKNICWQSKNISLLELIFIVRMIFEEVSISNKQQ